MTLPKTFYYCNIFCILFASDLLSQSYTPYIQGNSSRSIMITTPWFLNNPGTTFHPELWIGIDTNINNTSYTTKILSLLESNPSKSLFLREDEFSEQSYAYSPYYQQEFNITLTTDLSIGDTIDITELIVAFQIPLFSSLFSTTEFDYIIKASVSLITDNSVEFDKWFIYQNDDNENPWDFGTGSILFRRGWGFKAYHGFETKGYSLVCLLHEGIDLLEGSGLPNCFSSVKEITQQQPVLYPNIVDHAFRIELTSSSKISIQIRDLQGSLIRSVNYESNEIVDCSDLPSGLYIVHLIAEQVVFSYKIVKV